MSSSRASKPELGWDVGPWQGTLLTEIPDRSRGESLKAQCCILHVLNYDCYPSHNMQLWVAIGMCSAAQSHWRRVRFRSVKPRERGSQMQIRLRYFTWQRLFSGSVLSSKNPSCPFLHLTSFCYMPPPIKWPLLFCSHTLHSLRHNSSSTTSFPKSRNILSLIHTQHFF